MMPQLIQDFSKGKKGSVQMAEFKFRILKHFGVLSVSAKGWSKELNLVSYNDAPAKYDIRDWSPDHTKMGKGVTLNEEEFESLSAIISGYASTKYAQEAMQQNAMRKIAEKAEEAKSDAKVSVEEEENIEALTETEAEAS